MLIVLARQKKFLSTKKLYYLLNITAKEVKEWAHILMVDSAFVESEHQKSAFIIEEDFDWLVILIGLNHANKTFFYQKTFYFCKRSLDVF